MAVPSFDRRQGYQILPDRTVCENDAERLKRMTGLDYSNIRVRGVSGFCRNPVCVLDTTQSLALP